MAKISIIENFYHANLETALDKIYELEIPYFETGVPKNPKKLKKLLEKYNGELKVGSFSFPIVADKNSTIAAFKIACELTKDFDNPYFFSSTKTKKLFKRGKDKGYEILRKLGDIAESYGKFISMETHPPFCTNATEMLETMKNVDHSAVKINFDTANIYYYTKLKPGEGISEMKRVIDHIGSLHIKQTNGKFKTWYFPDLPDAKGIVDFKTVFDLMEERGFDGIYTMEIEGTPLKPIGKMSLDQRQAMVKSSVNHLKEIGKF
jgi:sugar phosphate isomerase/epimerase